jgi:hypothetical protein
MAVSKYGLFKYAVSEAPYFRWIVGHGRTENTDTRVPPGTWVVFLSRPGHLLSAGHFTRAAFRKEIRQNTELTRKLALNQTPPGNLPSLMLLPSSWKLQIHGPNDMMPNTHLELFDHTPLTSSMNMATYGRRRLFHSMCGVTKTKSGTVSFPSNQGETTTVKNLVLQHGKGIYFVVACRGTAGQNNSSLSRAMRQNNTMTARGGVQFGTPAINTTGRASQLRTTNVRRTRRQSTVKKFRTTRPGIFRRLMLNSTRRPWIP